jgi:hypothetical protein
MISFFPFGAAVAAESDHSQSGARKRKWTEEDELLRVPINRVGTFNWLLVASAVPGRTGKQSREQ